MPKRNFLKEPRKLEEALRIIANHAQAQRLTHRRYRYKKLVCPIGSLLTKAQLDYLEQHHMNGMPVVKVAKRIGVRNVELMTGMTIDQAAAVQSINDQTNAHVLYSEVARVLEKGKGTIGFVEFNIKH